jgi:hypothetical protein
MISLGVDFGADHQRVTQKEQPERIRPASKQIASRGGGERRFHHVRPEVRRNISLLIHHGGMGPTAAFPEGAHRLADPDVEGEVGHSWKSAISRKPRRRFARYDGTGSGQPACSLEVAVQMEEVALWEVRGAIEWITRNPEGKPSPGCG